MFESQIGNQAYQYNGISRKWLNISCGIGVVAFGALQMFAFNNLGKKSLGQIFFGMVFGCFMWFQSVKGHAATAPFVIGIGTYLLGWIIANFVLSSNISKAEERIREIEQELLSRQSMSILIEKGVIEYKILRNTPASLRTFEAAISHSINDSDMLSIAGDTLKHIDKNLAIRYYQYALLVCKDPDHKLKLENVIKLYSSNK